jgi:hypothetical protein
MAGRIYAEIELINGGDLALLRHGYALPADIRRLRVNACVDSGAYMLTFNETGQVRFACRGRTDRKAGG